MLYEVITSCADKKPRSDAGSALAPASPCRYHGDHPNEGEVTMSQLVLATGNKKKVEELNALLGGLGYEVLPQSLV